MAVLRPHKCQWDAETAKALSRMEQDWDSRAREAAEYYIATSQKQWHQDDFFQSGEINVANEVLSDPNIMRRGKKPARMRVLEIGCGTGRMTKALAHVFAEVHAVDISAEMIRIARRNLTGIPNVLLYKNNGSDLSELASRRFDFAFSFIVFQHISSLPVVENYVREVHRCLRPGGLFKFQVQGARKDSSVSDDTWVGVSLTLADAKSLAVRSGFDLIAACGEGTQYLWLWFLKPKLPWIPIEIRTQAAKAMNGVRDVLEAGYLRSKRAVLVTFAQAATGVRDMTALAWSPADRSLYGIMHGRDNMHKTWPNLVSTEDEAQVADEMDRVAKGTDFGWPYTYYDGVRKVRLVSPGYGGDGKTVAPPGVYSTPVVTFTPRSAPVDLVFYAGDNFPAAYRGGAFIALHGTRGNNGYDVVFVPFNAHGMGGSPAVFANGFAAFDSSSKTSGAAKYRPIGLAVGPDGALYVADSQKGRIWRLDYEAARSSVE